MNKVRKVFKTIDYKQIKKYQDYWKQLTIQNNADYFRRWLFAFCSVHTTWESNVNGYNAIKDFTQWLGDDKALKASLIRGRCGLHNNRTKYISAFALDFWSDPNWYYMREEEREPWWLLRDRIAQRTKGLGLAKTSFALEMAFPLEAEVVCLDVHMLRLYGGEEKEYNRFETDWIGRSAKAEVKPYMTRMVYWDKLQGYNDSRYWSSCLEV